ncbi:MAG: THUMP domain-containing protein [Egibacteraceae bacterium]
MTNPDAVPRPDAMADPDAVVEAALAAGGRAAGPTLSLWARCAPGLEDLAAAELTALGWRAPAGGDGLTTDASVVVGRADVAALERTLRAARTVEAVGLELATATATSLTAVREVVAALDLAWLPQAPFAVRAERSGPHDFTSLDLAASVGQAVIDSVAGATGRRLPVDLDDPTVVVRAELHDDRLRVGLALDAEPLHRRAWRTAGHHAGLRPSTAAALLALAGWQAGERLLDPMTGGATIPIEAALAAAGTPVRAGGARAQLAALGLADGALAAAVAADLAEGADRLAGRGPTPAILGLERYPRHVGLARANVAAAGVGATVTVRLGDATRLDGVDGVDVAVTNPPFGLRAGSPRMLRRLYREALARLAERLSPGGRVALVTPAVEPLVEGADAAGLAVAERRGVRLGDLDATAFVLEPRRSRAQRQPSPTVDNPVDGVPPV